MGPILNTTFLLPQTIISNGAITGNSWQNPSNLLLTDGDVAQSNPGSVASDVTVGNFPFNLPTNAIITGVEIELIGAYSGQPTSPSITITPYFFDNTNGTDSYYPYTPPQVLTITPTDYVLGSQNYQFASSFTPIQMNNFKLALLANGNIFVDAVKVNVYYYIPATPTPPTPVGPYCADCNSPIQVQDLYLALPFLANDRYMYLSSFNYPDGTPINYLDLGSCGGYINFTIDPDLSLTDPASNGNSAENVKTAIWTILPNGNVRFDFGVQSNVSTTRGLQFHTPYSAVASLRTNHNVGARVVISDNAPFLGQLLRQCQVGTIFSAPIDTKWNDVSVLYPTTTFNFKGAGISSIVPNIITGQIDITIPGTSIAPPQIISTTSNTSGNTLVTTLSANLTVSGLNRGVLVEVSNSGGLPSSVTVGGISAVMESHYSDVANDIYSSIWIVAVPITLAPPIGSEPVVVNLSTPGYITFGAECITGLNQTSPVGTTQSANGTNFNPFLTLITSYNNSTIIDSLATAKTPILYIQGAGQSLNWALTAVGDTRQGASSVQSAGLHPDVVLMQYSITQNTPWVYCALELKGINNASGVQSVTGLNTDNTDPLNPIIKISVDGTTITGAGTTASPLIAHTGGASGITSINTDITPAQTLVDAVGGYINITNPGSGVHTFAVDKVGLAGDATFISTLTSNATFQTDVNNFVSGGSSSNPLSVTFLDDFTNFVNLGLNAYSNTWISGNFTFNINSLVGNVVQNGSSLNHPGIIGLSASAGGFNVHNASISGFSNLINFANDFDITILSNLTIDAPATSSGTVQYTLIGIRSEQLLVSLTNSSGATSVNYQIGSGALTPVVVDFPGSGTWFKIRFVQVSGVVSIYLNSSLLYTGTPGFTSSFYEYFATLATSVSGISIVTLNIDYVSTNYKATR